MFLEKPVFDLNYIINAHNYQRIQDCLSEASDMAILIVDYQGVPITEHSRCSTYCDLVRSHPELNDLCRRCDSRGGLEAARLAKPYIYKCHMDLLDLAIPLVLNGVYVGAIMAGQVILSDYEEDSSLEKIAETPSLNLDKEFLNKLEEQRKKLPIMSLDRVQVIANMLFQINNYIIEEALLKIKLTDSDEPEIDLEPLVEEKTSFVLPSTSAIQKSSTVFAQKKVPYNSILIKPALDFIEAHFDEYMTLDHMASLCNISSSYFSKLFNKITGDNFSNYVNKIRISKACELLENSDMPITMIAFDLGYEDISYFGKVFKRITGLTPTQYKSNYS